MLHDWLGSEYTSENTSWFFLSIFEQHDQVFYSSTFVYSLFSPNIQFLYCLLSSKCISNTFSNCKGIASISLINNSSFSKKIFKKMKRLIFISQFMNWVFTTVYPMQKRALKNACMTHYKKCLPDRFLRNKKQILVKTPLKHMWGELSLESITFSFLVNFLSIKCSFSPICPHLQ